MALKPNANGIQLPCSFVVDLFLFYVKVQRAGGYEAAVANKLWKGIYMELGGHPSNTSAATCTRRHYEKSRFTFCYFLF
jgi:hypothetical protein